MTKNSVRTSKKVASKAAKILKNNKSKMIKSIAGSTMSNRKKTNKK